MQEKKEADFRYGLVRVRENAESIAFYGGEENELQLLIDRFKRAFENLSVSSFLMELCLMDLAVHYTMHFVIPALGKRFHYLSSLAKTYQILVLKSTIFRMEDGLLSLINFLGFTLSMQKNPVQYFSN